MLKIKSLRLSGWARDLNARGCPHCADAGASGGHTFHIMWYCPAAQAVWRLLLQLWQHLGSWRHATPAGNSSFLAAVFRVRLPTTPAGTVSLAEQQGGQLGRLVTLYREARHLADRLGVERWSHHLRAYNKMADAAADVTMNGRRSIQTFHPTPRFEWAGLPDLLLSDFHHWRSASPQERH